MYLYSVLRGGCALLHSGVGRQPDFRPLESSKHFINHRYQIQDALQGDLAYAFLDISGYVSIASAIKKTHPMDKSSLYQPISLLSPATLVAWVLSIGNPILIIRCGLGCARSPLP